MLCNPKECLEIIREAKRNFTEIKSPPSNERLERINYLFDQIDKKTGNTWQELDAWDEIKELCMHFETMKNPTPKLRLIQGVKA